MPVTYKYKISVSFHKGQSVSPIGHLNVPYRAGAVVKNDRVIFYYKKFVLKAERRVLYTQSNILSNSNLAIHQAIERCLLLYYANCSNFPRINNIRIEVTRSDGTFEYEYITDKNTTPLLFDESVNRDLHHRFMPTQEYLGLDPKGKALRISLSYWLEAINAKTKHIRFEHAWTAFNTIYTHYGKCVQEKDNHIYIRNQIRANEPHFTRTKNGVSHLNSITLRNYRWEVWLNNKLKNRFGTVEPVMMGISDSRLKNIFSRLYSKPQTQRYYTSVDPAKHASLQAKLSAIITMLAAPGGNDDLELAFFICINYAYFLRNQRIHGGSINSFCKISPSAEDREFENVSDKLIVMIKELYEAQNVIVENPNP